ncbi:IPT/TIG domain-containing protein [Endobacterium cereale]|uniref:IPT/TIG domain-containing protein n=1 Tax=Endobacterium cereale TaxID=2663029 RepID=UPI002B465152|nr:IPT/TIG domain-containing protein [Endobacterium cereale]MEB2844730.1 IPT/TIG domain-containing protein [Endobacterium cereale]
MQRHDREVQGQNAMGTWLSRVMTALCMLIMLLAGAQAARASAACDALTASWGNWQTFGPDEDDEYEATGFDPNEAMRYDVQTFGSSPEELDPSYPTPAGTQFYNSNIGDTYVRAIGADINISGIFELPSGADYEFYAFGGFSSGPTIATGSVRVRLICFGGVTSVSSLSPATGSVLGGNTVTITGSGMAAVETVAFGGNVTTDFTLVSPNQISVRVPPGAAGATSVSVARTGGGQSPAGSYTYIALPAVTSVSPARSSTTGNVSVVITGTAFTGATGPNGVSFGSTGAASYQVNSDTQITAVAPAGSAGNVPVTVTTVGGTSTAGAASIFTYVGSPVVSSLTPARGPLDGGEDITISGNNFIDVTGVQFGTSAVTVYTVTDANEIEAQVPAGMAGSVSVTVTALGGTGGGSSYTYVTAPEVTNVTPTEGSVGGGNNVTIAGTNLSDALVTFDGTTVPVTVNTANQITITAPPHAAGAVPIVVKTPGGSVPAGSYIYRGVPVISGISPSTGPLAGNNSVVITGSGLSDPVSVTFAGAPGTVTANSDTQMTVTVPAGSIAAPVDVVVTTAGGASITGAGAYTYLAVPTVTSIMPASGPLAAGTPVTISGTGFTSGATVAFGSAPASNVVVVDADTITAQSPAGTAGAVGVAVTTLGGTSGTAIQFTYLAAPVANPSVATVAANSVNNGITLDITGTALTGVAVASGTSITYAPTAGYSGSDSFTYRAINAGGTSDPATVTITVTAPVLVLNPVTGALPSGVNGIFYNQSFTATGGTDAYSFMISGGALPSGLTLSPAGVLSGTPTAAGSSTFQVTATDIYGAKGTASYTLTINEQKPVANPASATVAIGSTNNLVALNITGGVAASVAVDMQATNGTATASGTSITYTPDAAYFGPDSFTYTATNSAGISAPATVSVTVAVPTFVFSPATGSLPFATLNSAYSQQITASGGNGSYSYAVTTGALPAGLNLSTGGLLSGTPTVLGTSSFTITATDSVYAFGAVSYTLEVVLPLPLASDLPFSIAANSSATAVPLALSGGVASSVAVFDTASHGTATAAGTAITYEPTAGYSGSDTFTYTATNSSGTSAPATVTVTVSAPTLSLSPVTGALPLGKVGSFYNQPFVASAGTAPYSYVVTGGTLPAGLVLDLSTGALAGTPTTAGVSNFTVTATDFYGATGSSVYALDIAEQSPVANPVTANVVRGSADNPIALNITGGTATSVAVTTAPSNGTFSVAGTAITYTPSSGFVGTDSFAYTASNISGTSAPATVSIIVTNPIITLAPTAGSLPDGTVGDAYAQMFSASGGTAPYDFAVSSGSLPPGLAIAPGSNMIAGMPTAAGSYSLSVTATDAGGATGTVAYSMRVLAAALVLSPPTASGLPPATTGLAYSYTGITVTGGSGTASFAAAGLPPGLVMTTGGAINGTPTATGSYSLEVTATDTAGAIAMATYELTVNAGAGTFVFSPAGGALPQAMVGEAYSQDISANGGTAPLIYRLDGGSLPPGLVLNVSNGDLNGPLSTEAAPGAYSFTIGVSDAAGVTGSASFTLQVQPRSVSVDNKEVTVPVGGTPPNVYLNSGATGGPFVDAILGTVLPPSAGTAEIIRGELAQAGPVAPSGFYLRFTPNPAFSGRAVVGYQLISAFGASNVGTVAYNLNFNATMVADDIDELVHDFVRTRQSLLSSTIRVPGLLERRRMENARDPVTLRMSPQEDGMRAAFSTSLAQMEAARDRSDGLEAAEPRRFNIWLDGAIRANGRGNNDKEDDRWGSFALLSVGMDYLLSDRALIGVSAHFDRMTDPADEDAELTGNGWFAGPYVSMEIAKGVFFDTSLLYGGSWNDIDTPFFDGKFDTTRWMWDGSLKGEWYLDQAMVVTPKLRAVYLTETVKDYAVSNDAGDRLLLEGFSMEQLRASIGAEIERRIVLSNGMVLTPRLGGTVGFAGLDGEGTFATVTAGASLQTETAWMFDFALLFDIEGEGGVSVGARARMSTRF